MAKKKMAEGDIKNVELVYVPGTTTLEDVATFYGCDFVPGVSGIEDICNQLKCPGCDSVEDLIEKQK